MKKVARMDANCGELTAAFSILPGICQQAKHKDASQDFSPRVTESYAECGRGMAIFSIGGEAGEKIPRPSRQKQLRLRR